jgi:superfamily I DNA/RNA helicase
MEVALYLAGNADVKDSEEYVPPIIPNKSGPKVTRIIRSGIRDSYNAGYQFIAQYFRRVRKSSVAVALPFSRQLFPAEKQLRQLGVQATQAKGANLGKLDSGVIVTTYHQLKGLEFDHVILMGLEDKSMPERFLDSISEEDRPAEEHILQRLIYMAMTRSKNSLTLVGAVPFCRFFQGVPDCLFEDV